MVIFMDSSVKKILCLMKKKRNTGMNIPVKNAN